MTQDSKVFGAVTGAETRIIFTKSDIEGPMKSIFNRPMGANGVQEQLGIRRQTGNEVSGLVLDLTVVVALAFDHDNGL